MVEVKKVSLPHQFLELGCPAGPYSRQAKNLPGMGKIHVQGLWVRMLRGAAHFFLPLFPVVLTPHWTPNPEASRGGWCSGAQQQPSLPLSLSHPLSHLPWYPNGHRCNVLFFQGYFKHISLFLLVLNSSFQTECYVHSLPIVVKSYLTSFILPLPFQFVTLQFSLFCSF